MLNQQALLTPTAVALGTPLHNSLKERSAKLVAHLEELSADYDAALEKNGMGSLQESSRFARSENVLNEYMRIEDVLRGDRTPSYDDISAATAVVSPKQTARKVQRRK